MIWTTTRQSSTTSIQIALIPLFYVGFHFFLINYSCDIINNFYTLTNIKFMSSKKIEKNLKRKVASISKEELNFKSSR